MTLAALILSLAATCSGTALTTRTGALERDLDQSLKNRPVTKVINMLKDMKTQLETEMEDDKEVYEKLVCWCETGTKEKTKAIEEGEANIASLEASIEEYTAKLAELKELLANTKDEKNKNWDALNKASAMRMKENGEFHGTEQELMAAIDSAKQAIIVLSEQHPEFAQIRKVVKTLESLPDK